MQEEDGEEFAPVNVTFAPKDVTPVDFTPRTGLQGLGYCGLDPGRALLGTGGSEHIDLFNPQLDSRSQLFGAAQRGSRRGGVAGQVGTMRLLNHVQKKLLLTRLLPVTFHP